MQNKLSISAQYAQQPFTNPASITAVLLKFILVLNRLAQTANAFDLCVQMKAEILTSLPTFQSTQFLHVHQRMLLPVPLNGLRWNLVLV